MSKPININIKGKEVEEEPSSWSEKPAEVCQNGIAHMWEILTTGLQKSTDANGGTDTNVSTPWKLPLQ